MPPTLFTSVKDIEQYLLASVSGVTMLYNVADNLNNVHLQHIIVQSCFYKP